MFMRIFIPNFRGSFLFFIISTVCFAETDNKLTRLDLDRAVQLGLKVNSRLKAVRLRIEAKEAELDHAKLRPNPKLEIELENFGGGTVFSGTKNLETTALLSQTIETAGKRNKRTRVLQNEIQILQNELEVLKRQVTVELKTSFIKALALQKMHQLNHKLEEMAQEALNVITKRVHSGKIAEVDMERAHIYLMQLKLKHEDTLKELKTSKVVLSNLLKIKFDSTIHFQGSFESIEDLKPIEVFDNDLQVSPLLHRAKLQELLSRSVIDLERSKQKMNYDVGLGFRQINEADEQAFLLKVSVDLPFFNRNQGRVKAAKKKLKSTQQNGETENFKMKSMLYELWETANAHHKKIKLLHDKIIPRSKALYETMNKGYINGKFDYLEMFEAHKGSIESQQQYLNELKNFHSAAIKLKALTQTNHF